MDKQNLKEEFYVVCLSEMGLTVTQIETVRIWTNNFNKTRKSDMIGLTIYIQLSVDMCDKLYQWVEQKLDEAKDEYETLGFRPGFQFIQRWLDHQYPSDVFVDNGGDIDKSKSDIGVKMVIEMRRLLNKYSKVINN